MNSLSTKCCGKILHYRVSSCKIYSVHDEYTLFSLGGFPYLHHLVLCR